ncbi:MAG TPA: FKBP-type peptidyl-prolyl cis-trans isomerase [Pseudomonadales bacterium]
MQNRKSFSNILVIKHFKVVSLSVGIAFASLACGGDKASTDTSSVGKAPTNSGLETDDQKASYSVGYDFGKGIRQNLEDLDLDIFVTGLRDAFQDKEPGISKEEMQQAMVAYRSKIMEAREKKMQDAASANKAAGEEFLAANKDKQGVVTLPSGLQYKVLVDGSGKKPGLEDTVDVHYLGTLIDGTEFDSSYKRGQPATFQVQGVIQGWVEALQLMQEGAKWQLFIPADLAYGDRGAGQIEPGSMLIFEVELLKIK